MYIGIIFASAIGCCWTLSCRVYLFGSLLCWFNSSRMFFFSPDCVLWFNPLKPLLSCRSFNVRYKIWWMVFHIHIQILVENSLFCLFDLILYVSSTIFSVMQGRVFLGWTSTKLGKMCLAVENSVSNQRRPWSNGAFLGVWSGSARFTNVP